MATANFKKSKNKILNDVLKKNEESNAKVIRNIKLEDIDENPINEQIFNMNDIERLAHNIEREGFTGAITVIDTENGRYQINAGHRRYRAAKLLNMPTIPCIVEEMMPETMVIRRLLSSNIQSRDKTPLDFARSIAKYKWVLKNESFRGNTRSELSNFFGISEAQIYRYECINKVIPELRVFAEKPDFPYTIFEECHSMPKESQKELADRIQYYMSSHPNLGISKSILKQFIESIKAKEAAEKARESIASSIKAENPVSLTTDSSRSAVSAKRNENNLFIEPEDEPSFVSLKRLEADNEDDDEDDIEGEKIDNAGEEVSLKRKAPVTYREAVNARIEEARTNIDFDITTTARRMKSLIENEFSVTNSKEIKNSLEDLKDFISAVEEYLAQAS